MCVAMPRNPTIFLSYAAVDNRDGYITEFRDALSPELQIQTGEKFAIFQDINVAHGGAWEEQLSEELKNATFLIAILTPSYLSSEFCRKEIMAFLEREKGWDQKGLIFPVYYVDTPIFNERRLRREDPLAEELSSRKYLDWRELRFESLTKSPQARRALAGLARDIAQQATLITAKTALDAPHHGRSWGTDEQWKIEKLSLQNFRCFEELNIDFRRVSMLPGEWTCIAGINGSGKTSILQAICIALLGERAHELGGALLSRMRRSEDPSLPRTEITISLSEAHSAETRELSLQIDDKGVPRTRSSWSIQDSTLVTAYGSTRNLTSEQDTSLKRLSPEVQRMCSLFFPLTQLASAEVLLSTGQRSESFLSLFSALINQVFEKELSIPAKAESIRFAVMGKDRIEALDLPDGFRSSAAWLADLCAAWCDKHEIRARNANPAEIEAVVLIDEIDLHLHPSLQRELVPRLRKALPKVQWIVTTHSPLVLANFDVNEIIALDRDQEGNVRELDRQILGFSSDQIYQWLMGTPPTGEAIAELLEKNQSRGQPTDDEVAELLDTSPRVNDSEARERVKKLKDTIGRLKP